MLNYASSTLKLEAGQPERWYRYKSACKGKVGKAKGLDCDEYPYFSTEQGGAFAVPEPTLRPINAQQNRKEGTLLVNKLINQCGLETASGITATSNGSGGSPYLVLPMPEPGPLSNVPSLLWEPIADYAPLTFGICNGRSGGGGASDS